MTQKRYTEIPKRQKCINKEEPYIGGAKDILDDELNKPQSQVNDETNQRVSTLEESVGTGGSVDERIAIEKNRAEQAEGVLDGKVATEKERAEGVEGGLNTRLQTVEELASISVGGGDIGIGTAADFESDDPEDLAKVPTVGAVLGGANGVYDISACHNGTKYADLAAALGTNGANVPVGVRRGGMSVKYVQSSDNKYVQYRFLLSGSFTDAQFTDIDNWSFCDENMLIESAAWRYAITYSDGQVIAGVKDSGQVEWFVGIPTPVKKYIDAYIKGSNTTNLDGLDKIIKFVDGFSTSDSLYKSVYNKKFSDKELFNDLVEEFSCTQEFLDTYDCIQLECGKYVDGKYRDSFIFYKTGWGSIIDFFEVSYDSYDESVAAFIYFINGRIFAEKDCYIKFKDNISEIYGGKDIYGKINYYDTCLGYKGLSFDFLPILTLDQDNSDNILRAKIREDKYRAAIVNPEDAETILDYDVNEEMSKKTFQMLRTDEIVVNDNIYLPTQNQLGAVGFDGSNSNIGRSYFLLQDLSTIENVWNFAPIKTKVQEAVSNGKRYIPRLFVGCSVNSATKLYYTHINSSTGVSETHRINFPVWMADLMAADANAQWLIDSPAEQNESYWVPDYNVPAMRNALINGIRAFGDWLENETVTTNGGDNFSISNAFLYVEFNPLGAWGEGAMTPLDFKASVNDMLTIWQEFMEAVPDNVVTTGGIIYNSGRGIELTEKIHAVSNNIGPYGFTIEHLGAYDRNVHAGRYDKYVGKLFFSGEGAAWAYNSWWKGDCYYYTIDYIKRLQLSYARIQNWVIEDAALNPLKNLRDIAYKNLQMVAFIGYRYVLTPMYCQWVSNNSFRIYFQISNIGSSKCWWSFYETHVIVTDENDNIISDSATNIDITKSLPKNSANIGTYTVGDDKDLKTNVTVEAPTNDISFKVYIKVVDKYGIVSPLYFSNYGRVKEGALSGSYLIGGYNATTHEAYASFYKENKIRPI